MKIPIIENHYLEIKNKKRIRGFAQNIDKLYLGIKYSLELAMYWNYSHCHELSENLPRFSVAYRVKTYGIVFQNLFSVYWKRRLKTFFLCKNIWNIILKLNTYRLKQEVYKEHGQKVFKIIKTGLG